MLGTQSGRHSRIRAALIILAVLLFTGSAQAYPWMIRHHYSSCGACHYDPSGAGAVTPYGRAVADAVIRSGGNTEEQGLDLAPRAAFLFGAVPTPPWLELGGDARLMQLASKTDGVKLMSRRIWMQLDASATVSAGGFVASGVLGFAPEGALGAALTRGTENNLTSRQHWLGYQLGAADLLIRAGRMNLPFGVRNIEHNSWTRKLTRTTINDDQQYGASVYFGTGSVRGEVMGIVGNLQLRPDRYRERGYSAYLAVQATDGLELGVSSLITHRDLDTTTFAETWHQVHGVFTRWATPYEPLVLLGEWDYVMDSSRGRFRKQGHVGFLQADWEPFQGSHFIATGELNRIGAVNRYWSYAGWLSYNWFFGPHCDLRLDGIYQALGGPADAAGAFTVLLQGHVFL